MKGEQKQANDPSPAGTAANAFIVSPKRIIEAMWSVPPSELRRKPLKQTPSASKNGKNGKNGGPGGKSGGKNNKPEQVQTSAQGSAAKTAGQQPASGKGNNRKATIPWTPTFSIWSLPTNLYDSVVKNDNSKFPIQAAPVVGEEGLMAVVGGSTNLPASQLVSVTLTSPTSDDVSRELDDVLEDHGLVVWTGMLDNAGLSLERLPEPEMEEVDVDGSSTGDDDDDDVDQKLDDDDDDDDDQGDTFDDLKDELDNLSVDEDVDDVDDDELVEPWEMDDDDDDDDDDSEEFEVAEEESETFLDDGGTPTLAPEGGRRASRRERRAAAKALKKAGKGGKGTTGVEPAKTLAVTQKPPLPVRPKKPLFTHAVSSSSENEEDGEAWEVVGETKREAMKNSPRTFEAAPPAASGPNGFTLRASSSARASIPWLGALADASESHGAAKVAAQEAAAADASTLASVLAAAQARANRTVVLLAQGGYFAGAVFDRGQLKAHRAVHRYVVRKKGGQRQANRDAHGASTGGTVGSQMRRWNEKKHILDIEKALEEWKGFIDSATLLVVGAPGDYNRRLFSFTPVTDARVRYVPIPFKRPSFKAACAIYDSLTSVHVLPLAGADA